MADEPEAISWSNAQRWANLALKAGFQVTVAAGLIWFIAWRLDGKVDTIASAQTKIEKQNEVLIDQMWQLISVGQATCLAVGETSDERRACITVERRPR